MIGFNEIISLFILESLFLFFLTRYIRVNNLYFIKNTLLLQNIALVLLLILTHIFVYYNYRTFPDIYYDGGQYDLWARVFADKIRNGDFTIPTSNDLLLYLKEYPVLSKSILNNDVPLLSYSVGAILYTFTGHAPLALKFINIIFFQISTLIFIKLLIKQTNKINKSVVYIYAFNPVFIVYSISLIKESFIIFALLWFFHSYMIKSNKEIIVSLIIILLLRPYLAGICFISMVIIDNYTRPRKLILYALIIGPLFYSFELIISSLPGYGNAIDQQPYRLIDNSGKEIWVNGLPELFKLFFSNPVIFFKQIFYYTSLAFFSPELWVPQRIFYGEFAIRPEIISIIGIGRVLQSPIQLFIIYKIFSKWIGVKTIIKQNGIFILSAALLIFFNAIKTGSIRYQETVTFIVLMVIAHNCITYKAIRAPKKMLFILIIFMFFINDLFIRKRTILNSNANYMETTEIGI
jgi:hypothetical protein